MQKNILAKWLSKHLSSFYWFSEIEVDSKHSLNLFFKKFTGINVATNMYQNLMAKLEKIWELSNATEEDNAMRITARILMQSKRI